MEAPPDSCQAALHVPVLLAEVLEGLQPVSGGLYIDATFGLGGHARAILERSAPEGRVIGFEWDGDAVAAGGAGSGGDRLRLVRASYADLVDELARIGVASADGLVVDLGVSSLQLDRGERGFSFRFDAALDMRMDQRQPLTAAMLVARASEAQLADIFYHYGEERQARRIARFLVEARDKAPVRSTGQLAEIVARAVPRKHHPVKVHVATKVFQALRIAVNGELDNVSRLLRDAPQVLARGARLCIITFHSLEDRIVKQALHTNPAYAVLSGGPIEPSPAEVLCNPRARSARLRIAARV